MLKNAVLSVSLVLTSEVSLQVCCCKQMHVTLKLSSRATCWNELCVLKLLPLRRDTPKQMVIQKPASGLACPWGHFLSVQALIEVKFLCGVAAAALDPYGWDFYHLILGNELVHLNYELRISTGETERDLCVVILIFLASDMSVFAL